jgi:O-antigen ligase
MADTRLRVGLASRNPAALHRREAAPAEVPNVHPGMIAGLTALAAALCARFFADGRIKYGAALVLATFFAPLVFFAFPGAVAVWTAVQFFKDIRALSIGPNTMGVLVGLGFLGIFIARGQVRPALQRHRMLILGIVLFMLWLTISSAWALKPGTALNGAAYFWLAGLAFLLVMITLTRGRDISIVALAFVLGATVSAIIGLASGSLTAAAAAANSTAVGAQAATGRLTGGGGDPNLQAAGFIAAMFLAMGLLTVYRRRAARIGLLAAFAVITVAFFATQSRGGLLALGVSTIAALVLFPDQRRRLLGFVLLGVLIATIAVTSNPSSFARITNFGGGTSGRSDIWAVATKVFAEHPLVGVGLDNFQVVEPRFALLHKAVTRVGYIAETPYPAHNTYLQLLAETGVIGLVGFLAVVIGCMRAALDAARLFEGKGMPDYAHLARATLMGTTGMLSAIFFFTDGDDWRLWILLGLGPALLALAHRAPARVRVAPRVRSTPA